MSPPIPYETLFVARQPILDVNLATWGYFHYYRRAQQHTYSEFTDPLMATLTVIQCLPMCLETCTLPHKAFIHLPGPAIMTGIPKVLSPECVVPVLTPHGLDDPKSLEALRNLRHEGYSLALDAQGCTVEESPVLDLVDLVIVDMKNSAVAMLPKTAEQLRGRPLTLVAKRVETRESFNLAKFIGCTYFSGYFFREPETLAQRKISAAQSTRLSLLEILSRQEPSTDELVAAIETDASVSYRVLTLLNSAHFGLLKKVSSVRQAVLMAGWMQLCAWLRVMVMSDLAPSSKARELLHLSAQRAKFLSLLAVAAGKRGEADSLFLLGLFSLLPTMLDMPMADIASKLALTDDLSAALCGAGGRYAPWLALSQAIEDTRWDDLGELANALGLPTGSVSEAYSESFIWADRLVCAIPPGTR
jgi:c-di-GMP phosphodiesterase